METTPIIIVLLDFETKCVHGIKVRSEYVIKLQDSLKQLSFD